MTQTFNVNGRFVTITVPATPTQAEGETALHELREIFAPDPKASELLEVVYNYMARMQAANVLLAFLHQGFLVEEEPQMNEEMVWDQLDNPLDSRLVKSSKKRIH